MPRLLVRNFSISLDGYVAGTPPRSRQPTRGGGMQLHEWLFATRSFTMVGREGGSEGLDDKFFSQRGAGVGATIMGRNMFGPIRGPWGTSEWTGWWGETLPFIIRSSSSRTTRVHLSKWKGEPPSISSTAGST